MIVVDSSVVFEFLIHSRESAAIEERFRAENFALHAPSHLPVELLSVLRKHALYRGASHVDDDVVRDILILPVRFHSHDHLAVRIWELRHNITPYAAAYVALAEALDAPLLTRDRKLAKSTGHGARIEVV